MTEIIRIPVSATLGSENRLVITLCVHHVVPQDQLRGRNFTFWEWFYKHLDLIKTTLKREWMEG